MAKSKASRRGRFQTAIRDYLKDNSGRMPGKYNYTITSLPDWFYEPKAFQQRVCLRKLNTLKRRARNLVIAASLIGSEDRRVFHPAPPMHRPVRMLDGRQNHRLLDRPTLPKRRSALVNSALPSGRLS